MSYDEVDIEDMDWQEDLQAFTYQCPCGDLFQITMEELAAGEEIAHCPSCSLYITVIYNPKQGNIIYQVPTLQADFQGLQEEPAGQRESVAVA